MLGAIFGAGASLLGGILGRKKQKQQLAQQYAQQKEFAQHGIRWRVEDAKRSGIHPLYALGANTHSFSPIGVGGDPLSAGIAGAGQDIGRAIDAKRTGPERLNAVQKTMQDLSLQKMGLENQLLSAQIAKINQAGHPPPMAAPAAQFIDGQGNSGFDPVALRGTIQSTPKVAVENLPMQRNVAQEGAAWQEPAAVSDTGYVRTPTGYAPVMSVDAKERLEEDWPGMLAWNVRNRLMPSISETLAQPPKGVFIAKGQYWYYNPYKQEWQKRDRKFMKH